MKKTNRPLLSKIGNIVLSAVLVILALLIAMILYSKFTGKRVFSYSLLWVLSPSMEDTIPARSYILVKTVDAKNVNEQDIITFYSTDPDLNGALNTHRVKTVIGDHEEFITKGDNNPIEDFYHVPAQNLVSKYVCNLPILTFFGRVFATKTGFLTFTSFILILTFLWFRIYIFRTEKIEKQAEMERLVAKEVERLKQQANHNAQFK